MLITTACFVAWLFIVLPCALYLVSDAGWRDRRQRIFTYFNPAVVKLYFTVYFPSLDILKESDPQLTDRFKKHYGRYYGRRHYIVPLILLSIISALGLFVVSESLKQWYGSTTNHFAASPVVVSSFLGAFTWVTSDQIARFRRRDWTSSDVYKGTFRFLIAVPFGYSLAAFANKDFGIAIGFLLGAFPTETLFKISRRLLGQKLGLGEDADSGTSELEMLQNIGKTNAEKFYDEGITTITELAWTDPVHLSVRTNFDFEYVVDCMSKALLAVYVGKSIKKLARFSLRGAQEATTLLSLVDNPSASAEKTRATQALKEAANVLGVKVDTLHHTLSSVADDPYTKFLAKIWNKIFANVAVIEQLD